MRLSTATINRILHAHGLIRRRLAQEVQKTILLPAIQARLLPAYEYTAKDVATGIVFVCSTPRALSTCSSGT